MPTHAGPAAPARRNGVRVELLAHTGHSPGVLVKQLADAIREHCGRTGETERQLAIRIGMPHQNLYELLRRAEDPSFDVGRKRLERLAEAIGYRWKLERAPENGEGTSGPSGR